jgi:hypothetical protein
MYMMTLPSGSLLYPGGILVRTPQGIKYAEDCLSEGMSCLVPSKRNELYTSVETTSQEIAKTLQKPETRKRLWHDATQEEVTDFHLALRTLYDTLDLLRTIDEASISLSRAAPAPTIHRLYLAGETEQSTYIFTVRKTRCALMRTKQPLEKVITITRGAVYKVHAPQEIFQEEKRMKSFLLKEYIKLKRRVHDEKLLEYP